MVSAEKVAKAIIINSVSSRFQEARSKLFLAWHNFDNAEPEFTDVAVHQLCAAERQYDLALAEAMFDGDLYATGEHVFRKFKVHHAIQLYARNA